MFPHFTLETALYRKGYTDFIISYAWNVPRTGDLPEFTGTPQMPGMNDIFKARLSQSFKDAGLLDFVWPSANIAICNNEWTFLPSTHPSSQVVLTCNESFVTWFRQALTIDRVRYWLGSYTGPKARAERWVGLQSDLAVLMIWLEGSEIQDGRFSHVSKSTELNYLLIPWLNCFEFFFAIAFMSVCSNPTSVANYAKNVCCRVRRSFLFSLVTRFT